MPSPDEPQATIVPEEGEADLEAVRKLSQAYQTLRAELGKVIVGQEQVLEHLLIAIFARGHGLLVGVPGLAKTLMVSTLSRALDLSFSRIQFTPDLMPSDITGTEVIQEDRSTGERSFRFLSGPIFSNVILADEINRTPPKTQAALLEAMQERQVTAGGQKRLLPDPFFVLATQNPIEQEGTYPLPEAQLDRFMFKLNVPFLNRKELNEVLDRTTLDRQVAIEKVMDGDRILALRDILQNVVVAEPLRDYAARLVLATHPEEESAPENVHRYVRWGASPRASQALLRAARVRALTEGRAHISFGDIRHFAEEVLQHRVLLNYDGLAENVSVATLIQEIINHVPEEIG